MSICHFFRSVVAGIVAGGVLGLVSDGAAADGATAADLVRSSAPARDIRPVFDQFDENGDGRIDRIEFRVWIVGAFDMLDSNKDEFLDRAEVPSVGTSDFNKADQDNDGRLSAFEFIDSDLMKFTRFDLNRDGFITYEEVIASRRK